MANYTEAKAIVLKEMFELNERMKRLIDGLDAIDRIEDYDLIDQVVTMDKAQKMMADDIERAFNIICHSCLGTS